MKEKTKKKTAKKVVGVDALVSKPDSKWTRFMDMHSGGRLKEKWQYIYIEAPQDQAEIIFYNKFGHNPNRVTCTCCGNDYSISEGENLAELTAYDRGCRYAYFDKDGKEIPEKKAWVSGKGHVNGSYGKYVEEVDTKYSWHKYIPLEDYIKNKDVKFINASQIKPEECLGSLPQQGYVWCD